MDLRHFKTLRYYIFLLLTIFVTDTVSAGGMMLTTQLSVNHTVKSEIHNQDNHHDMIQHNHQDHDTGQKQSTNDNCSKCGHCLACFTVLPPSQLDKMQSQILASIIRLFEPSYLSHISAQPQRPPIS